MNKKELLIRLFENEFGKIPKTYIEGLSFEDTKKQLLSIALKKTRPKDIEFKSKTSKWTKKSKDFFGDGNTSPEKMAFILSQGNIERAKELYQGFREIINKGKGAYFSSGSRPKQSPQSWGIARLHAVLWGSPARKIDKNIVDEFGIPLLKSNL